MNPWIMNNPIMYFKVNVLNSREILICCSDKTVEGVSNKLSFCIWKGAFIYLQRATYHNNYSRPPYLKVKQNIQERTSDAINKC